MDPFLVFLLGAALLGTLLVLVIGVVSFAVHGEFYKKNSNKLMRLRVLLQGLALLFFAILLFVIFGKYEPAMVTLSKIYTRGGDKETSLGGGKRVAKHSLRVAAYGTSDEANAVIGIAPAFGGRGQRHAGPYPKRPLRRGRRSVRRRTRNARTARSGSPWSRWSAWRRKSTP